MLAFEDETLTSFEKQIIMLSCLYPVIPDDVQSAATQAVKFLDGGKDQTSGGDGSVRVYSFLKDADLIFAAFRQVYGINLETVTLHWWAFMALFMTIFGTETSFGSLVNLRSRIENGTATKEEREAAQKMGDTFEIPQPDTRTPAEKQQEDEFMRLVAEGGRHGG